MFVDNTRYFWKVFAKCHGDMDKSLGSLDRREVHKVFIVLFQNCISGSMYCMWLCYLCMCHFR
jgi:hypothetical protein